MSVAVIFTGLAWGMLLAAAGLALWTVSCDGTRHHTDGFRQAPGLSHAGRAISWLAGALLLIGSLLAWWKGRHLPGPAWRLMLMAALAAPAGLRSRRHSRSPWDSVMLLLPALTLAGVALFWIAAPIAGAGVPLVTPAALVMVFCGGLGARALGEGLSELAAPPSPPKLEHSPVGANAPAGGAGGGIEWPSAAAFALLTLLAGGAALANLWQRGTMWEGAAEESVLAGIWLTWSAAWLSPRERPRLRAALIVIAASLLIILATD